MTEKKCRWCHNSIAYDRRQRMWFKLPEPGLKLATFYCADDPNLDRCQHQPE